MKNLTDYKRFGLEYLNNEIETTEGDGFIQSGRVKILDCGCVYLDDTYLEEACNLHANIDDVKQQKIAEIEAYYQSSEYRQFKIIANSADEYYIENRANLRNLFGRVSGVLSIRNSSDVAEERRASFFEFTAPKVDGILGTENLYLQHIIKVGEFLERDKYKMYKNHQLAIQEVNNLSTVEEVNNYDYISKLNENILGEVNIVI